MKTPKSPKTNRASGSSAARGSADMTEQSMARARGKAAALWWQSKPDVRERIANSDPFDVFVIGYQMGCHCPPNEKLRHGANNPNA